MAAYSSRSSEYLKAGWADASLTAKTPFADLENSNRISFAKSSEGSASQKHIYVTGRYNFAHIAITMKDYISQIKPHPAFKEAMMNALATESGVERSQEVKKVLQGYGSMFVTSVEVGGMKHSTIEGVQDEKRDESAMKLEMSSAMSAKLKVLDVETEVNLGLGNKRDRKSVV